MEILPLSAFHDNYIWALCSRGACVVVDPGDASPVDDFLVASELRLAAILLTHRHNDHQGGVKGLLAKHRVEVYGPSSPLMPLVSKRLEDGMAFKLPCFDESFEVLAVPGHTEEHIAYLTEGALFCGDTLFGAGCGRLLGGTATQLHTSLGMFTSLPSSTRIYPAHEYTVANLRFAQAVEPNNPAITQRMKRCLELRQNKLPTLPTTLEEELATNPFLRVGIAQIKTVVENELKRQLESEDAVFAALREWKDNF